MNYNFKLSNIKVSAPDAMVDVTIGEIAVEVTDLNLLESLKIAKELPGIIRELREAIETPIIPPFAQHMPFPFPMPGTPMGDLFARVILGGECPEGCECGNGDSEDSDSISADDEIESVDADATREKEMFEALIAVTSINAGEFTGGLDTDKERGTWDTKAYSFRVALSDDGAMHSRKRWMFIGGKGPYDVYIKAEDKDSKAFGEQLKAQFEQD